MRDYSAEVLKMQQVKKRLAGRKRSDRMPMKPVCFFCDSPIRAGEEIISRKDEGFYHRKCFDFLLSLTSKQVIKQKKL
jgi:hypothetical protein